MYANKFKLLDNYSFYGGFWIKIFIAPLLGHMARETSQCETWWQKACCATLQVNVWIKRIMGVRCPRNLLLIGLSIGLFILIDCRPADMGTCSPRRWPPVLNGGRLCEMLCPHFKRAWKMDIVRVFPLYLLVTLFWVMREHAWARLCLLQSSSSNASHSTNACLYYTCMDKGQLFSGVLQRSFDDYLSILSRDKEVTKMRLENAYQFTFNHKLHLHALHKWKKPILRLFTLHPAYHSL